VLYAFGALDGGTAPPVSCFDGPTSSWSGRINGDDAANRALLVEARGSLLDA
jgi:hypothetical protein